MSYGRIVQSQVALLSRVLDNALILPPLQDLDERCEDLLYDIFHEKIDFDVSDACNKMKKLGIASKVRPDRVCIWMPCVCICM